ncbi:hypothetical protein HDU67_010376 [Dinochytrium kinnereticum]|nr:hypothetical protein HDU67_010376 [Dinochytrium kinnereticum]
MGFATLSEVNGSTRADVGPHDGFLGNASWKRKIHRPEDIGRCRGTGNALLEEGKGRERRSAPGDLFRSEDEPDLFDSEEEDSGDEGWKLSSSSLEDKIERDFEWWDLHGTTVFAGDNQYTGRQPPRHEPQSSLSALLTGAPSLTIPLRGFSAGMTPRSFGGIRQEQSYSPSRPRMTRPDTTSSVNSDAMSNLSRMLAETSTPSSATTCRGSARTVSYSTRGEESFESIGFRTQSEEDMVDRIVTFATRLGVKALETAVNLSPGTALSASVGYPEPHMIVRAATAAGFGRRSTTGDDQRVFSTTNEDDYEEGGVGFRNPEFPQKDGEGRSKDQHDSAHSSYQSSHESNNQKTPPDASSGTSRIGSTGDAAGVVKNGRNMSKSEVSSATASAHEKILTADRKDGRRGESLSDNPRSRLALGANTTKTTTLNGAKNDSKSKFRSEAIIRYLELRRQEYHEQIRQELLCKAERSRLKRQKLEDAHKRHVIEEQNKAGQKKDKSQKRPPFFLLHETIPEHYRTPKYLQIEAEMHPNLSRIIPKDVNDDETSKESGPVDDSQKTGLDDAKKVQLPPDPALFKLGIAKRVASHLAKQRGSVVRAMPMMISLDRKIGISAQTLEVWGIDVASQRQDPRKDRRLSKFSQMADTALRNKKAATRLVTRFSDLPFRDLTTGMPTDPMIELGLIEDNQYERDLNDVTTLGSLSMPGSPEPLINSGKLARIGGSASSSEAKKNAPPPKEEVPVFTAEEMAEIQQKIVERSRRGTALLFEPEEPSEVPDETRSTFLSSLSLQNSGSMLALGSQAVLGSNHSRSRSSSILEKASSKSLLHSRAASARQTASRSASVIQPALTPRVASGGSRANSVVMFADQAVEILPGSRPRTASRVNFSNRSTAGEAALHDDDDDGKLSTRGQSLASMTTEARAMEIPLPESLSPSVESNERNYQLMEAGVTSAVVSMDNLSTDFTPSSRLQSLISVKNHEPRGQIPKPKVLPLSMDDVLRMENVKLTELKHLSYFRWQMPEPETAE